MELTFGPTDDAVLDWGKGMKARNWAIVDSYNSPIRHYKSNEAYLCSNHHRKTQSWSSVHFYHWSFLSIEKWIWLFHRIRTFCNRIPLWRWTSTSGQVSVSQFRSFNHSGCAVQRIGSPVHGGMKQGVKGCTRTTKVRSGSSPFNEWGVHSTKLALRLPSAAKVRHLRDTFGTGRFF